MAELGSWPSIQRYGLLSTTAILDKLRVSGEQRQSIEERMRPQKVPLQDPHYGNFVIRDQKVLHQGALEKLVDGMSSGDYYKLLNGKTFFWVRRERLVRILGARAYKTQMHIVLTVDTKRLLATHQDQITLSPINSGAIFGSGRRGTQTFKAIADYPFDEFRKRKKEDAIVELAVEYSVDDMRDLTEKVEEWKANKPFRTLWRRKQAPKTKTLDASNKLRARKGN